LSLDDLRGRLREVLLSQRESDGLLRRQLGVALP
jgi:hypothetical protein